MRFRTAILWNIISQFGQSGITLLSTIILARLLTPDDFGIVGIVTVFIALSQMMVDSEMGGALLRKKEVDITDYSTLFYYNLGVSIIIYLILYFTAPLISDFYTRPSLIAIIRLISLTIIIHAFRVVQRIIIFRDLKFKIYALINVSSGLVSLGIAVFLAYRGYGYWALVWQQISLALCNVILMSIYTKFIPSLIFSKKSFKYQFSFGISLLGSDTIKTIANNVTTNIIAKITTLQFTGYYTQSSRLTNFCQSSLSAIMDQSIFPMMAKFDSIEQIKKIYYKFLNLLVVGLTLVTCFFIVFSNSIIELVLGKEWLLATSIFKILSLTILPVSLQILCRNILKTLGTTKLILKLETIKSIIIISMLSLGTLHGQYYVIYSLVSAQILSCIIWLIWTNKKLNELKIVSI